MIYAERCAVRTNPFWVLYFSAKSEASRIGIIHVRTRLVEYNIILKADSTVEIFQGQIFMKDYTVDGSNYPSAMPRGDYLFQFGFYTPDNWKNQYFMKVEVMAKVERKSYQAGRK